MDKKQIMMEDDDFFLDFCINADFLDSTIHYTQILAQLEVSQGSNKDTVVNQNEISQGLDDLSKELDMNMDTTKVNKRFKIVNDSEHKKIQEGRIPSNTRNNTNWGVSTYSAWAEFRNEAPETKYDPKGMINIFFANKNVRNIKCICKGGGGRS